MSERYAQVAVPNVPKALSYRIDRHDQPIIQAGSLVKVPVGKISEVGLVLDITDKAPAGVPIARLKSIYESVYPYPVLTADLIALTHWLSEHYAAGLGSVLESVIPSVIRQGKPQKIERSFLRVAGAGAAVKLGAQQKALVEKIDGLPPGSAISFAMINAWGASTATAHALVAKGILTLVEQTQYRGAYNDSHSDAEIVATTPPPLMDEQQAAVEGYSKLLSEKRYSAELLHGVTGSGKTEVYLRLISQTLEMGGSALLLVPEVALTPQMIGRLRGRFGRDPQHCVVWHSHLSPGERADAYRAIVTGVCKIVVGARSALFAPLQDLRLIIVDEEHEGAYKQEENPRYHARDAALKRAELCGALCILGSATPSLETIHQVRQGTMNITLMKKRIDDRPMPIVHVVDLRKSLGKTPWLSTLLKEKLSDRLEKGEQALLFLNRRGHSTSFLCQKCGHIAMCHQCSIALTYHAHIEKLRCHMCGYETNAPQACPDCGSNQVRWRGVGTQKIEALLKTIYPKARIARVDSDSLDTKNTLRGIFSEYRRGNLDILVGTQMIAKGLDFPNVTLVGLIDADLSLHQPDFRAAERTFQLLVQVAGRAGRGDRSGEVVVQTFLPHSSTLQYARHVDYEGFVEEELAHRKEYAYPPYRHLIAHLFRATSPEKLNFYCEAWAREVTKKFPTIEIRGPSPAPIEKIEGMYRYHLWYLCDDVDEILQPLLRLKEKFPFDPNITESIDVDATQLA